MRVPALSMILISGLALQLLGCSEPQSRPRYVRATPPPAAIPVMNLPPDMREWNWGGGSCVHASTVMVFRWLGQEQLADYWRRNYSGGETSYGIQRKLDREGVDYITSKSRYWRRPEEHLECASRTRRGAVIFYYPRHSICFCGYANVDGEEYAVLLDNNRIDNFIRVRKRDFIQRWHSYGAYAVTPLFSPTPPPPYHPYRLERPPSW